MISGCGKLIDTVILRSQQAVLSGVKEESRIVLKTLGARSFAAAQDDSIEAFFRTLPIPTLPTLDKLDRLFLQLSTY
jgi:hypothetical protein